jgi:hypothetical protein
MDYPEHPLISNIDNLTDAELSEKISELNRKLSIAYRMANHDLCNQVRMALVTYNAKYQEKIRKNQNGTDFGNIINIE